ncbi:kinesin-like protein KIF3A-like isoform X2 [Hibiscus syriacus]|uniref:Kinesin-like protein KIF3A-like isoform X2 n=1 Tax=Hibiscus syriacus TaxID=106335 RepID=A0A6A2X9B3_HIBSY|nr:kinesin-like protein KIF3A-like isoform X2 [Hibiscus syriacus]
MNHSPGDPPAAYIHFMQMKAMDSKKSIRDLGETIHSLLGFKSPINSAWVKSVCQIIKSLPNEDGDAAEEFSKIKGNIRVFCRVRPLTLAESIGGLGFGFGAVVALDTSNLLLELGNNKSKRYTFDKVFQGSSQDGVFSEVEPVIKSVLDGYNACIFAYGQTGTGKTFTMEGTLESPGIVPRTIETLFKQTEDSNHTFLITFSMLEIYLGKLRDLLVPQATRSTDPLPPCLSIQTDPNGGIRIENLVSIQVSDFNQALKLYRFGCQLRSTASTNSNTTSSRSHCMIRISITCFDAPERRRETNKIWLVDLGGSERVVKTKAWGRRLDEGRAINLSLSALGDVIHALQRSKCHIPYRNSKLTRVLKDSLGDDSKTLMLVHVSPKEEDLCETICSLNFASRAKNVRLGHEESNEVKNQREAAMQNLQQKIKEIEDERQHIRGKLQISNRKLEVTRKRLPLEDQVEPSDLSTELVPPSELEFTKSIKGNVRSEMPSFMRSTICSRTKTGMERQTSLDSRRKRRPTSQRAESVSFPVKNNSECNSDYSISRSTCAVEFNKKTGVELDNATVYSQDILECDIKTVILPDRNMSQMTSNHRNMEKRGSIKSNKCNSTKVSKVDQWFTLHKDEPTISGPAPRNKWVLDIPLLENKQRSNGEKMQRNGNKKQKQADLDQKEEDKPTLKDLFAEESSSSLIFPPQSTTDDQKDSLDSSSVDDSQGCCGSLSRPDSCCNGSEIFGNEDELYGTPMVQAVEDTDHSMIEIGGHRFSPFDIDDTFSISQVFGVSVQELGGNEDMDTSPQSSTKERLKSQRALFIDDLKQKDHGMAFMKSQETAKKEGAWLIQESWASALLGLGFLDLGFNQDFFYGLIL